MAKSTLTESHLHAIANDSPWILRRGPCFGNTSAGKVSGATTDGFRFVVESYDPSNPRLAGDRLPRGAGKSSFAEPPMWSWPPWETPQWYAEVKPLFAAMQRTFAGIPEHPPAR